MKENLLFKASTLSWKFAKNRIKIRLLIKVRLLPTHCTGYHMRECYSDMFRLLITAIFMEHNYTKMTRHEDDYYK